MYNVIRDSRRAIYRRFMRFIIPSVISSHSTRALDAFSRRIVGQQPSKSSRCSTYYKMPKKEPRRTAVLRILTAAPIWEGYASKKALRGVIIGLPRILSPHPFAWLLACRASRDRKERNEIRDSDCEGSSFTSPRRAYAAYSSPAGTRDR